MHEQHKQCQQYKDAFPVSDLAGWKESALSSLNERSKVHVYIFARHNSLNSRALADGSGENWAALIHEQGHCGQNQFWELVRSILELTGWDW